MSATALRGTVERYISQPREEGFAILSITLPSGTRVKVCGKGLAGLADGQAVEFRGQWTTHQRWGRQFRASDVRVEIPDDLAGLKRWLVDVGIPGVPSETAHDLVDRLGKDVVALIVVGDDRARGILGSRFDEARRVMTMHKAEAAFGPLLAEHDIGPELRRRIFHTYGLQTARQIEQDPYRLVDINGVSFATADRIAKATGVAGLSRTRLIAAAVDALRSASNDGHTAIESSALARMVTVRTGIDGPLVSALMADIEHEQTVATTILRADGTITDGWALRSLDADEGIIAENVLDKLEQPSLITPTDAKRYVETAERLLKVELNKEQREGAIMALSHSFAVLTGGPGTGKTTTLKVITTGWQLAAEEGWVRGDIRLGAPTGKAAQRMKESTGIDATTVHRLLEVNPETGGFVRDETLPIEAGFIAIDECSMKDVPLTASFTRAWGDANVLLIGDPDQLASVGPGRVLGDLIDSGAVPVTHLVQVRRQAEGSAIAEGAKAIREGRMPVMAPGSDFMMIECEEPGKAADIIAELHGAFVADGMTVQALTPGHQKEVGTIALNARLQMESGFDGPEVRIASGSVARVGDKVIQIVNDNDAEVFNGDAGSVAGIAQGSATIRLGEREVTMDPEALEKLSLAYALTIHKSQGSEYEVVLMPMTTAHRSMLKRSLIYTGLTRAKQICIVVGSRKAVQMAIENDDGRARTTTLAQRLRTMSGI